jgi:hypothetical protein
MSNLFAPFGALYPDGPRFRSYHETTIEDRSPVSIDPRTERPEVLAAGLFHDAPESAGSNGIVLGE